MLTEEEKLELYTLLAAQSQHRRYNKIEFFKPYKWQRELLFPTGISEAVRGVLSANRAGKSYGCTYELGVHVTGKYPADWTGYRYDTHIDALVLGYDYGQM